MNFFYKTLGGLKLSYYFRNLFFGLIISYFCGWMLNQNPNGLNVNTFILLSINALLYPYARFIYEQIIAFIFGDNIFIVNTVFLLFVKIITMVLCWALSIFIAPLGLVFIYIYHSIQEKKDQTGN